MIYAIPLDLSAGQPDTAVVLPILLCLVFFITYWFTAQSEKIRNLFHARDDFDRATLWHFLFNKTAGFLFMGVLPLLICLLVLKGNSPGDYGLSFRTDTLLLTLLSMLILSLVVIPIASFSARKPENLKTYPQIRARTWDRTTVFLNIAGWALYLLGYEILFRGVLLMPLAAELGIWPAIAINIALYSSTHIPKGLAETLGAIPLGLVFCLITLSTGTIWAAFVAHLALALANSFSSLKHHPEIHYKKSN